MSKKESKQYSSPEILAAYLKNGHRQWIRGRLYEMFKIPNDNTVMVCAKCEYFGHCPLHLQEVCTEMKADKNYKYGLKRVL